MHFGVILGVEKRPRKKMVEKVKIELSCRRHAYFRGCKGSENLLKIDETSMKRGVNIVVENENPKKGSKKWPGGGGKA